ncbi:MAG: NTP transferase domain-containing protein, partial [Candidatus Aegiribacteria sp.]|nr:NTP transferase domain-containing protein [Candidatus Aegiribacteria sp.]
MNACVILAAGKGKRMKSHLPKVVHPVLGVPMVARVLDSARRAGITRSVVVVGYGRDHVIPIVESYGAEWRVQEEQLGTAHAVSCGMQELKADSVTVLLGDVPLITTETVRGLEASRHRSGAAVAVLTTRPPNAAGYGRIVRGPDDSLEAIVE